VDVAVVGAGVAGLTAARSLTQAGHSVTVFDKGRRPGGRLSTNVFANGGRADIGAQFFTVRSPEFGRAVAGWSGEGLVHEWCRGFDSIDGHPRYAVPGGMALLATALAGGLEVRCSVHVERIRLEADKVLVDWPGAHGHQGGTLVVDAVIVTAPVPQSGALLDGTVEVPSIAYDPTISLAVAVDRKVRISASGGRQLSEGPVWSFIGDNQAKGASGQPVITMHSTPGFAASRFDRDTAAITEEMLEAARPFLHGASVLETQLQRWRYATPAVPYPERTFTAADGRVVLAGDAFGGPRVEGAFLSGLSAAEAVQRL